jgi:mono/diheme cytochrome c family protein
MKKLYSITLSIAVLLSLTGCLDSRDGENEEIAPVIADPTITADSFLKFINTQAALSAGQYNIVAATVNEGESDSYSLTITFDDGSTETVSGSWDTSGGINATHQMNPTHSINLEKAGGLHVELTSTVDNYLFITRNDNIIAEDNNSGDGNNATIALTNSRINSLTYAQAYYSAVDPNNERTTLAQWKAINGFDEGADNHIIFRDRIDLGYGRDMYSKTGEDGSFAFYVENYVVQITQGDVSTYAALSLDAALAYDEEFHISTNAIEYSPIDPNDPDSEKILKLFTFSPRNSNDIKERAVSIDLDGRGEKFMPTACLVCHGGTLQPLNADGSFSVQSLRSPRLNNLNTGHFTFSNNSGFTEEDQKTAIKAMNQLVHSTYSAANNLDENIKGRWSADFALEINSGAYNGDFSTDSYNNSFTPDGWQQNANRPDGVERLYHEVVKDHCIACHSIRGTSAGENLTTQFNGQNIALANAINFSSYEKFISYQDSIIELVYRRGIMPMSLLNYSRFWESPDAAPTLLASFLPNFDAFDQNGAISEPKKPVAVTPTTRISSSPVVLDASASYLADNFQWQIVSTPLDANASLSNDTGTTTTLSAAINGEYVITLTASNANSLSDTEQVVITIDNNLSPTPTQLTFTDDIEPIITANCVSCHVENTTIYAGIPVYYEATDPNLYQSVLTQVNLNDAESSLLLVKPTNLQHGGAVIIDRTSEIGEQNYQTILSWIVQGAPCGNDNTFCQNIDRD